MTIVAGLVYLAIAVNWLTAAVGAATWVLYVVIYTPLKTRHSLNTVIGVVAGAFPTLMGWSAVGGSLAMSSGGVMAATLFVIVYLWQFPHFMAIAWIYRRQYAAAGLKMLTVVDASGWRAGQQARHRRFGIAADQPRAHDAACRTGLFRRRDRPRTRVHCVFDAVLHSPR